MAALRHLAILLLLAPAASFLSPTLLRAGGALRTAGAPGLAHQHPALSPASGWWPRQTSTCRSLRAQISEIAPFGEGLRVLSLREQRELLEFLQNARDPAAPFTDSAPSWAELKTRLAAMQTAEERVWKDIALSGRGPATSIAPLRLFDAPDGMEPRVTLYRDSASWCPYCQKVWLLLEEKRVPYRVEKINMRCYGAKPDWFKELNPSGNVPLAKIDGVIISDSNSILAAIEETFTSGYRQMLPAADSTQAARVPGLLKLERELFNHWMRWLVRETEHGDEMMQTFEALLSAVDAQLATAGPFFLGAEVSMVDCMFAPFLERMAASVPYYKGLAVRGNQAWPHLQAWYTAMDLLPSFRGIQSDYYTHCHGLPPQIGSCESHPEARALQRAIDGQDGVSWAIPLPAIDVAAGFQPALIPDETACREAAARVLASADALVPFCLRALGASGPCFGSALADPGNVPDMRFARQMDAALRHVVDTLLSPDHCTRLTSGQLPLEPVGAGLAYLRERVSVPRDMSWPAARQLRAHLTAVIRAL